MHTKATRINKVSQVGRFFQISGLLLWMMWVMYRERHRVMHAHEQGNYAIQPDSDALIGVLVAFRETALKSGVLMIKLGQFLSSRVDLLPEQAIAVLSSLQDEVPPIPFAQVVEVIEAELERPIEDVFSILERKCTAAASLGQVHKAVLASNGETVAVKIQRPNCDWLVHMDLRTIKFVIWLVSRFVNMNNFIDLMAVYQEFERTVYEELDYVREAANAKRFKEMFKDDPTIYIPHVYEEFVSRRMLVLEWIDGIKVSDYAALDAAGVDNLEVAKRTVRAYFYQFFEVGFFHADPHPGNILVKRSTSAGPVIVLVDFGMVGTLTREMKRSMKDAFIAFIARDAWSLVNALARLGFIGEGANTATIERVTSLLIERYHGMTLAEMRELDIPEVVREIGQMLYGQPVRIPARFAATGRAVGTLIGVSTGLAPEFNFTEVAGTYARKFLGLDAGGMGQTAQQLFSQLLTTGRTLMMLPGALEQLISRLESGQIEVKLSTSRKRGWSGLRQDDGRLPGTSSFNWLFMFVMSLAGGIFLLVEAHLGIPGWFCLGLAALSIVRMLIRGN
jgi:predicted unusual protein kinase regulating ubiquinone biosynthesis (AarF/ABC1/UbiB family)